jgi:hypothetical protein|mmetsp:Transcript_6904/g.20349  ORF Transcript_6904/g.20349 Transcript_6904/m.20349 type:complete len:179 (-) Transcript_6904:86-622(-)
MWPRRPVLAFIALLGLPVQALALTAQGSLPGERPEDVLKRSADVGVKVQATVVQVVHKSFEQVTQMKSLLTTNAKAAKAMNDLLLEMNSLGVQMETFNGSMEKCARTIHAMKAQTNGAPQGLALHAEPGASPDHVAAADADAEYDESEEDGVEALLQLGRHAETLRQQIGSLQSAARA